MPPKRSAKVVVSKKVVQETVQVSIQKRAKEDTADIEELPLKSISIEEGEEAKRHKTVQIAVEVPSTCLQSEEPKEQQKQKKDHSSNVKSKGKRRKRRREGGGEEHKTYVFRVLKQVHPGMAISSKAMTVINNYMAGMFERIANEATTLSKYNKRTTMSSREIQGAVKLLLPGDLGKHTIAEGNKAVTNHMSSDH